MSRHIVYRDSTGLEIIVGYDRPLTQLYVQWITPDPEDKEEEIADSIEWDLLRVARKEFDGRNEPGVSKKRVLPTSIALHLPDMWDAVRQVGSVSTSVMDDVTREIMNEIRQETTKLCDRVIDWTKGIPTEGI